MKKHYLPSWAIHPEEPLHIILAGCGGNGSQMLTMLADMNHAMRLDGAAGLHVTVFDPDTVDEFNPGRQKFSDADRGLHKARLLVQRVNQFYGLKWDSHIAPLNRRSVLANNLHRRNFLVIGAVDQVRQRYEVYRAAVRNRFPYWLDLGNGPDYGQAVLGTIKLDSFRFRRQTLPDDHVATLPDFFSYSGISRSQAAKWPDDDSEPSCSMAEALGKQDLFINRLLVSHAANLLWRWLKYKYTPYYGVAVNSEETKMLAI